MAKPKLEDRPAPKKRGRGRPAVGENEVGPDRLVIAAKRLLREMPPGKVTQAKIAHRAGSDPGLINYYFGDRTKLFMAVIDEAMSAAPAFTSISADGNQGLENLIEQTVFSYPRTRIFDD